MDDREKIKVESEARARAGDPLRTSVRREAVNRYLGAFYYADTHADRKPAETAPRDTR